MAIRTTTSVVIPTVLAPSACQDAYSHADFSYPELERAYASCRKNKSTKPAAIAFSKNAEANLWALFNELKDGSYRPGASICFIVTRPKPREIWAADFRDRIVQHLLYNRIAPRFYASFIADNCACIPGRGTLYATKRLETKIRSITRNWSAPAYYLKCDVANFFVSIDKPILWRQLAPRITEPWWLALAHTILFHDPRENFELRGSTMRRELVPPHKRLVDQDPRHGLPIGNLTSQFFANVHLDALDQFIKHQIGARYYIRYVDDFVILHESPQWLNAALCRINDFLARVLNTRLNPTKTVLQPIARGVDFVGHVIKPWNTKVRRKTVRQAVTRLLELSTPKVFASTNSYLGLMRQASCGHADRVRVARIARMRGYTLNGILTKTYKMENI